MPIEAPRQLVLAAAYWAAEEYERRTRMIAASMSGSNESRSIKVSMYWVSPGTRVDWHEICAKFNMQVMGPVDQVAFQPAFHKEMRRRHLLPVLRGTMKADQWVSQHG